MGNAEYERCIIKYALKSLRDIACINRTESASGTVSKAIPGAIPFFLH